MAKMAGITPVQLDYLVRLGVVAPDVGGHRKHYSEFEMRLAVIAGEMLQFCRDAKTLKGSIDHLRSIVTWPDSEKPSSLDEMHAHRILELFKKLRDIGAPEVRQRELLDRSRELFSRLGCPVDFDELAASDRRWTQEQLDRAHAACFFEGAALGIHDCFLGTDINSFPWRWELDSEPSVIIGARTTLSISVRILFNRARERVENSPASTSADDG
ncbi:hypothetical protein [Roseovarius sp. A46]|uniref:hypothetical protein n=1 Tax=Roseovarius sp. A46 TaxID=2109331 RepID=UPI00101173D4|nr:hypothetical protein [Roseovarius sp. A46]